MNVSFSTLACPGWSVAQVIDHALRIGYDGVELRLLGGGVIDPVRDRAAVRDAVGAIRGAGLEVCALDTSCRFNLPDTADRASQLTDLRRWIALAHEVSVPVLRVFGGEDPGDAPPVERSATRSADPGVARVAEALAAAAREAERAGVIVALETHDGFSSAHRLAAVLAAVPSPAVASLWDSHHPYRRGESPERVFALIGGRTALVHVKDARRHRAGPATLGRDGAHAGSDEWDLVPLGDGEVPVREMLATLAGHGYDRWISVEWEKRWHPELAEPEIALPQHRSWLRDALAALHTP